MAKLPKDIRRPGGDLVAPKRPHGRRLLLPAEVEFCELLKCTEDEYWDGEPHESYFGYGWMRRYREKLMEFEVDFLI